MKASVVLPVYNKAPFLRECLDSIFAQSFRDYELIDPGNTAARGALLNQTCELIARLSDPYRDDTIVTFYNKECK